MSITVTNNADGTYRVACGDETVIVGSPRIPFVVDNMQAFPVGPFALPPIDVGIFPPISRNEGGVVAHIVDVDGPVLGVTHVADPSALIAHFQAGVDLGHDPAAPGSRLMQVCLDGSHALDVAELRSALDSAYPAGNVAARIFVGKTRG
jgi:hypothetical protein